MHAKIKLNKRTMIIQFLVNSVLLLVYFIINLFYLNYWEYPEMVIPIMTFCILSMRYKKDFTDP